MKGWSLDDFGGKGLSGKVEPEFIKLSMGNMNMDHGSLMEAWVGWA